MRRELYGHNIRLGLKLALHHKKVGSVHTMENVRSLLAEAERVVTSTLEHKMKSAPSHTMITGFSPITLNLQSQVPAKKIESEQDTEGSCTSFTEPSSEKKMAWKKPNGMPRRPLSAYNLFFKSERQRIVIEINKNRGPDEGKPTRKNRPRKLGIGFAGLARDIAKKWKSMDKAERALFEDRARVEKERYDNEVELRKRQHPEHIFKRKARKRRTQPKSSEAPLPSLQPSQGCNDEFYPISTTSVSPKFHVPLGGLADVAVDFARGVPNDRASLVEMLLSSVDTNRAGNEQLNPFQPLNTSHSCPDITNTWFGLPAGNDIPSRQHQELDTFQIPPNHFINASGSIQNGYGIIDNGADELEQFMESIESGDMW